MTQRRAGAYKTDSRIVFYASSKAVTGVWVMTSPVFATETLDPEKIGKQILDVLQGSKHDIPHPDARGPLPVALKALGVKSWKALAKGARSVGIVEENGLIKLTPRRNRGPKDGFESIEEKGRSSSLDATDLGAAMLAAFEDCE